MHGEHSTATTSGPLHSIGQRNARNQQHSVDPHSIQIWHFLEINYHYKMYPPKDATGDVLNEIGNDGKLLFHVNFLTKRGAKFC